ncbi:MAG: licheninase [Pseudomonas sp.]|jgi:endo-1,4-beta-D-glucanase Y|uniref:glycosyl hydrolase family 8 n=1 Tax=Pseudomonas sp. TaxID=306 RepID=UPI00238BEE7A|nr:glycosyl hydrolase family 8 [Pseudomonas sp.]MDP9029622.1 glycosyl hydrolase family 8 [Pseudomonadota bacterium]MDE1912641.1 licheninase [Pseudomonas sp.]MDE2193203.1 licheninase [Pseudomonas sp.]MDE2555461.1 licheninase [Pseudomonas sp.]MDP9061118.1 glycosyl hydrolase family 8 [Pseudomonadota bacterium]
MRHPKRHLPTLLLSLCMAAGSWSGGVAAQNVHAPYYPGTILPNRQPQATMDQQLVTFYKDWKAVYLSGECGSGRYFIKVNADHKPVGGGAAPNTITVSEAHGYGMLLTVMMADYDDQAQRTFDGMVRYFQDHPAASDPGLMAWNQTEGCGDSTDPFRGDVSATDGDLDIAYALLLADQKWGSEGSIDYRSEANTVMAAIMKHEVHPRTQHLMLGDWAGTDGDAELEYTTRSSDFMQSHLYSFFTMTGDKRWQAVRDKTYSIISDFTQRYSANSGLVPDFISHLDTSITPARPDLVEGPYDGSYSWNAARYPWRIGLDYLMYGDPRALYTLTTFNRWARATTHDEPGNFNSGYRIDGSAIEEAHNEPAFVAALGVSAMINPDNQLWLNNLWDNLQRRSIRDHDYYGNTLKLLGMVVMSGHWERPQPAPLKKTAHVPVHPSSGSAAPGPVASLPPASHLMLARGFMFKKLLGRRGVS